MRMAFSPAVLLCVTLSGCGAYFPQGKWTADLAPAAKPQYAAVFDAAVKACRELDLPLNLANKDVGQIQCGLKSSEAELFAVGYSLDALIERDADQAVKNVSVKVLSRSGLIWRVGTDADATALAQRYLTILQRAGVR